MPCVRAACSIRWLASAKMRWLRASGRWVSGGARSDQGTCCASAIASRSCGGSMSTRKRPGACAIGRRARNCPRASTARQRPGRLGRSWKTEAGRAAAPARASAFSTAVAVDRLSGALHLFGATVVVEDLALALLVGPHDALAALQRAFVTAGSVAVLAAHLGLLVLFGLALGCLLLLGPLSSGFQLGVARLGWRADLGGVGRGCRSWRRCAEDLRRASGRRPRQDVAVRGAWRRGGVGGLRDAIGVAPFPLGHCHIPPHTQAHGGCGAKEGTPHRRCARVFHAVQFSARCRRRALGHPVVFADSLTPCPPERASRLRV